MKALVLAGGFPQIALIKELKKRGITTLLADYYEAPVAAELPAEDQYELVRTKTYEMKPMSVQDAILNMEVLGHEFYMFFNSDENKICTVYRRKDGGFGMIMPQ
jgi:putative sigma-54 modulation protein